MQPTPHLFTIRVWQEEVEDGVYEWRGSIRYGIDGQIQHFAGAKSLADVSLADVMQRMVGQQGAPEDKADDAPG